MKNPAHTIPYWILFVLLSLTINFGIGIILMLIVPKLSLSPGVLGQNNYNLPPENPTIVWRFLVYAVVITLILLPLTVDLTTHIKTVSNQNRLLIVFLLLISCLSLTLIRSDIKMHTQYVILTNVQSVPKTDTHEAYYKITDANQRTYKVNENNYLTTNDPSSLLQKIKIIYNTPVEIIN